MLIHTLEGIGLYCFSELRPDFYRVVAMDKLSEIQTTLKKDEMRPGNTNENLDTGASIMHTHRNRSSTGIPVDVVGLEEIGHLGNARCAAARPRQ